MSDSTESRSGTIDKKKLIKALRTVAPVAGRDDGAVTPAGMAALYSDGGRVEVTATDCRSLRVLATFEDPGAPALDVVVPVATMLAALGAVTDDASDEPPAKGKAAIVRVAVDDAGEVRVSHGRSRLTVKGTPSRLCPIHDPVAAGPALELTADPRLVTYVVNKDDAASVCVAKDGTVAIAVARLPVPRCAVTGTMDVGASALALPAASLTKAFSAVGANYRASVNGSSLVLESVTSGVEVRCEVRGVESRVPDIGTDQGSSAEFEVDGPELAAAVERAIALGATDVTMECGPDGPVVKGATQLGRGWYSFAATPAASVPDQVTLPAVAMSQALRQCHGATVVTVSEDGSAVSLTCGAVTHRVQTVLDAVG